MAKKKVRVDGPDPFRLTLISQALEKITTEDFRTNHVVYKDDPSAPKRLEELARRPVPTSTILVIDRDALNKLKREVARWLHITAGDMLTVENRMQWSAKSFKAYEQGVYTGGWKELYIQYALVWSASQNHCVIHHIENTTA